MSVIFNIFGIQCMESLHVFIAVILYSSPGLILLCCVIDPT